MRLLAWRDSPAAKMPQGYGCTAAAASKVVADGVNGGYVEVPSKVCSLLLAESEALLVRLRDKAMGASGSWRACI